MRVDAMNSLALDLELINGDVVRMLSMVRESCELARRSLVEQDVAAAQLCSQVDVEIDRLQADLELRILSVFAERQPAAGDLRFLGASLQALADIERAGDYAEHVAEVGAHLAGQPRVTKYLDFQQIFEVLSVMLDLTAKAAAEADVVAARRAHALDNEIDDLYDQVQRELLSYMLSDASAVERAAELSAVARYLERLGDHLENVNEHVIFWLEGKRPGN